MDKGSPITGSFTCWFKETPSLVVHILSTVVKEEVYNISILQCNVIFESSYFDLQMKENLQNEKLDITPPS